MSAMATMDVRAGILWELASLGAAVLYTTWMEACSIDVLRKHRGERARVVDVLGLFRVLLTSDICVKRCKRGRRGC